MHFSVFYNSSNSWRILMNFFYSTRNYLLSSQLWIWPGSDLWFVSNFQKKFHFGRFCPDDNGSNSKRISIILFLLDEESNSEGQVRRWVVLDWWSMRIWQKKFYKTLENVCNKMFTMIENAWLCDQNFKSENVRHT